MRKTIDIKSFRERIGVKTQGALAKILKVSQENVSLWERGKGFPSYKQLKKLFEMGATVEELFGVPCTCIAAIPGDSDFERKVMAVLNRVSNSGTIQIGVR